MTKIRNATLTIDHTSINLDNDFLPIGRYNSDQSINISLRELIIALGDASYIIEGDTILKVYEGENGYAKLSINSIDYLKFTKSTLMPYGDNVYSLGTASNRIKDIYLGGSVLVGGDTEGDLYFRKNNIFTRLPIGNEGTSLKVVNFLPSWEPNPNIVYTLTGEVTGTVTVELGGNVTIETEVINPNVNTYLNDVNANNISNVIFTFTNGDIITESFAHVHTNYALKGWVETNYASQIWVADNYLLNTTDVLTGVLTVTDHISTPTIKLTSNADVNKFWRCTNADGSGEWVAIDTSLSYSGSWNADTNTPHIEDGIGTNGEFYRVVVEGTRDLGSGTITFPVGRDVMYNGSIWELMPAVAVIGNALTKVDDANITLTLGGLPATSLLNAVSLTLGWTGVLSHERGGLEADVNAYNGLVKISDGATSYIVDNSSNWNSAYTHSQLTSGNPHHVNFNELYDNPNVTYTLQGDVTGSVTVNLGGDVTIDTIVNPDTNAFLNNINSENISNVIFSFSNGDSITESFAHVHTNYALKHHHLRHEAGGDDEINIDGGSYIQ